MRLIVFVLVFMLTVGQGFTAVAEPILYLNPKANNPSSLRMLDFLYERLGALEIEMNSLTDMGNAEFSDFPVKTIACVSGFYPGRTALYIYQESLLSCVDSFAYRLRQIQRYIAKQDPSHRTYAFFQDRFPIFFNALQQLKYELKGVFHASQFESYEFPVNDQLVLVAVQVDHNYTTIIRGRSNGIFKDEYLEDILRGTTYHLSSLVQINWSKARVIKAPKVVWIGPMFEIRIPIENMLPKTYRYVFEEGELHTQYMVPQKSKLSVSLCKKSDWGLLFNRCLTSNEKDVFIAPLLGTASIEPSALQDHEQDLEDEEE